MPVHRSAGRATAQATSQKLSWDTQVLGINVALPLVTLSAFGIASLFGKDKTKDGKERSAPSHLINSAALRNRGKARVQ